MSKTLSVIIIGCLAAIIFIQLTCNKPAKVVYPDYSKQLQSIEDRMTILQGAIEQKEFKKVETRNEYTTIFLGDTSTNADTIYWVFKSRLDSLGAPRFN